MTTEIKFRAKLRDNAFTIRRWFFWKLGEGVNYDLLDMETVGQFSGVFDESENAIYTGDVVRYISDFEAEYRYVVVNFKGGSFRVGEFPLIEWGIEESGLVVGNIYDNSELIK